VSAFLLIAHRGIPARFPENTKASFRAAVRAGARCVELDTRLTKDGVPVVLHDEDTARTTGKRGLARALPAAKVLATSMRSPSRERVPTLADVLGLLPAGVTTHVELKCEGDRPAELAEAVLGVLREQRALRRVVVSSGEREPLRAMRDLAPAVRLGVVEFEEKAFDALAEARRLGAFFFAPSWQGLRPRTVARAHALGCRVYPYTVNSVVAACTLQAIGCDGMYTDDIVAMRDALRIARGAAGTATSRGA
jgi:glycerophosphoryl diester phosphodiesterase